MLTAYLKNEGFQLPIPHVELVNQVSNKFGDVATHSIYKTLPISKIEGVEMIEIRKQKTNIFLFNLYLNLVKNKGIEIVEGFYNDSFITKQIQQITGLSFNDYNDLEQKVLAYLGESQGAENSTGEQDTQTSSLKAVNFSLDWVKQAHKIIQVEQQKKSDAKAKKK